MGSQEVAIRSREIIYDGNNGGGLDSRLLFEKDNRGNSNARSFLFEQLLHHDNDDHQYGEHCPD
jgi:hypothetical protein